MHERDRQTDGRTDRQTPGYSKDRAYAYRRVVKSITCIIIIIIIKTLITP